MPEYWELFQYPAKQGPVGDPADWVEPVEVNIGWWRQTDDPVLALEYVFGLPYFFYQGETADFVTPVEVDIGWWRQTDSPVWPEEYVYLMPSIFGFTAPEDFPPAPVVGPARHRLLLGVGR